MVKPSKKLPIFVTVTVFTIVTSIITCKQLKKILNIQHNCVMLANGTNKAAFL